jgi:hypothetical protein
MERFARGSGWSRDEPATFSEASLRVAPGSRSLGGLRDPLFSGRLLPAVSLSACRRWHRGRGDPPADSLGCTIIAEAPDP